MTKFLLHTTHWSIIAKLCHPGNDIIVLMLTAVLKELQPWFTCFLTANKIWALHFHCHSKLLPPPCLPQHDALDSLELWVRANISCLKFLLFQYLFTAMKKKITVPRIEIDRSLLGSGFGFWSTMNTGPLLRLFSISCCLLCKLLAATLCACSL